MIGTEFWTFFVRRSRIAEGEVVKAKIHHSFPCFSCFLFVLFLMFDQVKVRGELLMFVKQSNPANPVQQVPISDFVKL